jgi:hypothetical protein
MQRQLGAVETRKLNMEKKRRRPQSTGKPASYIGKLTGSHPASPISFYGDLHQFHDLCSEAEVLNKANQANKTLN